MSRELTLLSTYPICSIHFSALTTRGFEATIQQILADDFIIDELSILQIVQILQRLSLSKKNPHLAKFITKIVSYKFFADIPPIAITETEESYNLKILNYVKLLGQLSVLLTQKSALSDLIYALINRIVSLTIKLFQQSLQDPLKNYLLAERLIKLYKLIDTIPGYKIPVEKFTGFITKLCTNCTSLIVLYLSKIEFITTQIESSLDQIIPAICTSYGNIMALALFGFKEYIKNNMSKILEGKKDLFNKSDADDLIRYFEFSVDSASYGSIKDATFYPKAEDCCHPDDDAYSHCTYIFH